MVNIIFDTDPGSDDALALAVSSVYFKENISLLVSTFGNTDGDTTFRNLVNLNNLLGINAKVLQGSLTKMKDIGVTLAKDYHGKYGLCGVKLPDAELPDKDDDFLKCLYNHILSCGKVTYISVGPLTNLASLLTTYPDVKAHINQALIMGGGLDIYNSPKDTEFNFACDPKAVEEVLKSGINIKLFPLDTTHKLLLNLDEVEEAIGIKENDIDLDDNSPFSLLARIFYGNYKTAVRHNEGGAIIHDATTLLYLIEGVDILENNAIINVDKYGKIFASDAGKMVDIISFKDKNQMKTILKNTFEKLSKLS